MNISLTLVDNVDEFMTLNCCLILISLETIDGSKISLIVDMRSQTSSVFQFKSILRASIDLYHEVTDLPLHFNIVL